MKLVSIAMDPQVIDVYRLESAPNVCNQHLREAISLERFSLAHVTMLPSSSSLLHRHSRMQEVYVIVKGEGLLYCGDEVIAMGEGSYKVIPPNTPHKLHNAENVCLEHLVIAVPPFDPTDVELLADVEKKPSTSRFVFEDREPITARDGATIYELFREEEKAVLGLSLALGRLGGKKKALTHHHNVSEEIYYVTARRGKVRVGALESDIRPGSLVYIPKGVVHSLENTVFHDHHGLDLEVLCIACPPYANDDFIIEE